MAQGTLSSNFNDRGFTFIRPEESSGISKDIFLHIRWIESGQDASKFVRGATVEFEIEMVHKNGEEKPQARNVRLLSVEDSTSSTVHSTGHRGVVKFWLPQGYGFIVDEGSSDEFYAGAISVPSRYLRQGDIVQFDVEKTRDRSQAVNVTLVGWQEAGDRFTDNLDLGHPKWPARLAELAEKEPWNYEEKPAKDEFVILRSYVKYTFLRLHELPGHLAVSHDGSHLAFNTGLVTPFQEEIFALFTQRPATKPGPPWLLRSFEKASSVAFLKLFGGNPPPLAWYYDDASQLVLDTALPLNVSVEHVPHDPKRFPSALSTLGPQDLAGLVNSKAPEAVERVRRNYKTAIPQFYRDGKTGQGKMQVLLPVALLRRDQVELALAVDRLESHVYLGRTVLTLDWAYNNARLLTRPDRDWLRP